MDGYSMNNRTMIFIFSVLMFCVVFIAGIRVGYHENGIAKRFGDPSEYKIRLLNGELMIQLPAGTYVKSPFTNEDSLKDFIDVLSNNNVESGIAEKPNKFVRFVAEL